MDGIGRLRLELAVERPGTCGILGYLKEPLGNCSCITLPSLIPEFVFAYMDVGKGREHDSRDGGGRVAPGAATEDAEALPF